MMREDTLKNFPRLSLGQFPTPIQKLASLSEELGQELYVKRDDYSGVELSGNKIRKLEYCLAEARELGCDTIITTGAIQSNHCRATAAAAAICGFSCELILRGEQGEKSEGNLFLELALGARLHIIPYHEKREEKMASLAAELERQGRKPYLIPVGASNAVGSQGYRRCYQEIQEQERQLGLQFDAIALSIGSGGTFAGLWYENERQEVERRKEILGFSVSDSRSFFAEEIRAILMQMSRLEEETQMFDDAEFYINDHYIGAGYAKTRPEELAFILETAAKTGILFDPCYTGKGFLGLYSEMKSGALRKYGRILFIHSGGLMGWTQASRDQAMDFLGDRVHKS